METIHVRSSSHSYSIYIGEGIRHNLSQYLKKEYSSILIITDEEVADLYLNDLKQAITHEAIYETVIPAGEKSKNIETFYKLQTKAIEYNLDRESLIIALGGGVVGDLAGFAAATYMRGIDYIQVPTTILAHDSSVGGKVAINHELGKNLIGSFYPPQMVLYDVQTLQSLKHEEIRSGYAELVKEALIADETFYRALLDTNLTKIDSFKLVAHLRKGIEIKAKIVEEDEKETGIRKYLNLGHTLGHALEAELGYGALKHGEAVAIGLLFAFYVSENTFSNKLPSELLVKWMDENGYPLQLKHLKTDVLINKMKTDKKAVNNNIQMVLLKNIAEPTVLNINDDVLHDQLYSFLENLRKKFNSE